MYFFTDGTGCSSAFVTLAALQLPNSCLEPTVHASSSRRARLYKAHPAEVVGQGANAAFGFT